MANNKLPILIIAADFYPEITDAMVTAAADLLNVEGYRYEIINVTGALEIPAAIAMAIKSKEYAGYVALGCVIRGETSHYDTVCNESARGLCELSMRKKAAIGNGIITVENRDQAMDRALPERKNKGKGAAEACLVLLRLREKWDL